MHKISPLEHITDFVREYADDTVRAATVKVEQYDIHKIHILNNKYIDKDNKLSSKLISSIGSQNHSEVSMNTKRSTIYDNVTITKKMLEAVDRPMRLEALHKHVSSNNNNRMPALDQSDLLVSSCRKTARSDDLSSRLCFGLDDLRRLLQRVADNIITGRRLSYEKDEKAIEIVVTKYFGGSKLVARAYIEQYGIPPLSAADTRNPFILRGMELLQSGHALSDTKEVVAGYHITAIPAEYREWLIDAYYNLRKRYGSVITLKDVQICLYSILKERKFFN